MTFTHAWQTIKDNTAPLAISALTLSTSVSLYAFGGDSAASAADHTKTEQWSAWMAANLTEAMTTGSNATIQYVIDQMGQMQQHCVETSAKASASATTLNVFASMFLLTSMLYGGYKIYDEVSKRRSGYTPSM